MIKQNNLSKKATEEGLPSLLKLALAEMVKLGPGTRSHTLDNPCHDFGACVRKNSQCRRGDGARFVGKDNKSSPPTPPLAL